MVKQCFFIGCNNNSTNCPEKLFLSVPQKAHRRKLWFEAAGRANIMAGNCRYCCEDHFNLERDAANWMYYKMMGTRIILKHDVVPVKKAERETSSQLTPTSRKRKFEDKTSPGYRRNFLPEETTVQDVCLPVNTAAYTSQAIQQTELLEQDKASRAKISSKLHSTKSHEEMELEPKTRLMGNIGTQTDQTKTENKEITASQILEDKSTNTPALSHRELISTDQTQSQGSSTVVSNHLEHSYSCQPSTSSTRNEEEIDKSLLLKVEIFKLKNHSRLFLGLPASEYTFINRLQQELQVPIAHILIVLKKIRTDDEFLRLAIDFSLSTCDVGKIFNRTLPLMAAQINKLIISPDKEQTQKTMPRQFPSHFNDVDAIIDCFEIQIEKFCATLPHTVTWNSYKGRNTRKFLISCSPNGFVNFVSEGFGGQVSDLEIIEKSGYFRIVPEKSVIMADRGFKQPSGLLHKKKVSLVRSPSVTSKTKMSKDVSRTSKLAAAAALRIHIERLIRRIREFRILGPHATTNYQLLPLLDYMVIVACGIINLQGPTIR